jgi:phosphatidylinositol-3-phosphatase
LRYAATGQYSSPYSVTVTRLTKSEEIRLPTLIGVGLFFFSSATLAQSALPPRPDHVVIVIEENHDYSQIIGSTAAPYLNALAGEGGLFTNSHAVTHPSQPNYLELFSGSDQGVSDDTCPPPGAQYTAANLGAELLAGGFTFEGYSEDLPNVGSLTCSSASYARKHAPWVDWQGTGTNQLPSSTNQPFTSFPIDFTTLPTVSIVVPNLDNDMHNGSDPGRIQTADTWLHDELDPYVQWARTHSSLLIITLDENDGTSGNRIATILVGPMVKSGQYGENIDHFSVLRTIEDMYGLGHAGAAGSRSPILDCWTASSANTPPSVSLTSPPDGAGFIAGSDVLLAAAASDTDGTISKVEFFHGTTLIGADTTSPYSITWSSVPAGSYALTARATDNAGSSTTSNPVNITVTLVAVPPTITTQPVDAAVTVGETASFYVVASGTSPLTFRWQENVADIPGAESAVFVTPPTTLTDNGATFRVIVTNSAGSVASNSATLTLKNGASGGGGTFGKAAGGCTALGFKPLLLFGLLGLVKLRKFLRSATLSGCS